MPEAGEPYWLTEDREIVLMWATEERLCPHCGTYEWEWDENPEAWFPDMKRCRGCELRKGFLRAWNAVTENSPPSDMDGLQLRMFRTPRRETASIDGPA